MFKTYINIPLFPMKSQFFPNKMLYGMLKSRLTSILTSRLWREMSCNNALSYAGSLDGGPLFYCAVRLNKSDTGPKLIKIAFS